MSKIDEYLQYKERAVEIKKALYYFGNLEIKVEAKNVGYGVFDLHVTGCGYNDDTRHELAEVLATYINLIRPRIAEEASKLIEQELEETRLAAQAEVQEILADSGGSGELKAEVTD